MANVERFDGAERTGWLGNGREKRMTRSLASFMRVFQCSSQLGSGISFDEAAP